MKSPGLTGRRSDGAGHGGIDQTRGDVGAVFLECAAVGFGENEVAVGIGAVAKRHVAEAAHSNCVTIVLIQIAAGDAQVGC